MSQQTGIEWTDATWNPIRGCTRVSEGCRHCYAETVAARFSGPGQPYEGLATRGPARWTGKVRIVEKHLTDPLRWTKPRRVFVNSMSDLFHEAVPDEWIDRIFAVMALAPRHTFQTLTKRPERMRAYLTARGPRRYDSILRAANELRSEFPSKRLGSIGVSDPGFMTIPNVWLGVSVEDQATADARIPLLLQTPAAVRFVSAEPLLGPVDLRRYLSALTDTISAHGIHRGPPGLDWIIVGGESGPGARPMHPAWALSVVRQCRDAGVACFVKQEGAWTPRRPKNYCRLTKKRWSHESIALFEDGTQYKASEPDTYGTRGMAVLYRHGGYNGDPAEWPEDLRVREFPKAGGAS